MRREIGFALWALLLGLAPLAHAQRGPERPPPFMEFLIPPELVMEHQRRIELSDEQRAEITGLIQETQATTLELQWQLKAEEQQLGDHLAEPHIDEEAALEQVERLVSLETQIKLAHFRLLVRLRNRLEPEQLEMLRDLRRRHRRERRGPRRGDPGERMGLP